MGADGCCATVVNKKPECNAESFTENGFDNTVFYYFTFQFQVPFIKYFTDYKVHQTFLALVVQNSQSTNIHVGLDQLGEIVESLQFNHLF